MKGLRLLSNGEWNKPPILTAARRLFVNGLAEHSPKCTLGDAASFLNGTSYDVSQVSELGASPMIRISNITDPSSTYLRTSERLHRKFWVSTGDLLVSWSASFKSIIWPGAEGYLNQHIFKVTERQGFDRSYIRHAIEASFEEMQQSVVGIGMMHLRREDFLGQLIPAPSLEIQRAVGDYLDFLESDGQRKRPVLPAILEKQRQVVARIEELAAQVQEARTLRQQAAEEAEAFVTSVHVQLAGTRTRKLSEIMRLDEDTVPVFPDGSYPQVGVKSFGAGLFAKPPVLGMDTTYKAFNRLYAGALVLSQVKGWEGAIAICPPDLGGWFVSPEYRTFRCMEGEARPAYLAPLICTEWFWRRLGLATRGVGARRERTRPEQFLNIEVPMPDVEKQRTGEDLFAKVDALRRLQAETAAELDALLPSILDKAFKGEL
jgi:hypothetical protein